MSFDFSNKKILITGSTGSIGSSMVKIFSDLGATIICTSTSENKINDLKNKVGNSHFYYNIDFFDKNNFDSKLEEIFNEHNDINVIINNAGYNADNLSLKMKNEEWDKVIDVNLTANFRIIKKFIPQMMKSKNGRVIGISSVVAFTGNKGQVNYSASKSGMIGMYKSFALEYASRGITFNIIAPGFIKTSMTDRLDSSQVDNITKRIPLNKLGTVEDVAFGAVFLASDRSGYITGQTLHINGGMLMI
ncbi:MAG: 3-oxoacyl-[acyl-carrier-protein] reductase FabG [Alphaproteobacteria bacterium MarineAlpha5_Bin11]|nr:MAG: 3-oxoacyl-[acyl-carrier-protein] reductase FabG [Alphaproteobacteria bacterium MarineAlpha5_Bin11]|tara:strand:- start:16099 stop:16839 length:741 start_codon:yes stop_codon:yes gene_type:complete